MAKQTGLGDQLFIAGVDIGADINSIGNLSTPRNTLPATGITQSANARMFGTTDASGEFVSYFNDAAGQAHPTLKGLPRTDVHLMYLRGTTLGNEAFCCVSKQIDYNPNRGDDGSLLFTTSFQGAAYGADWCDQLTPGKTTHASATNGTSVDLGTGSLAFGFQAYLQVFSLGSGTPTVKLQESSDNGSGDAFTDITGGTFGVVTAGQTTRIASTSETLTDERYVRVVTTGTFTDLVFAVGFNRNRALRAVT